MVVYLLIIGFLVGWITVVQVNRVKLSGQLIGLASVGITVHSHCMGDQDWHYCQLCIPIYLQFPSLFETHDVSKYDIRYQWM